MTIDDGFERLLEVWALLPRRRRKPTLFSRFFEAARPPEGLSRAFRDMEDTLAVVPERDWPAFRAELASRFDEPRRATPSRRGPLAGYQAALDKVNEARAYRWFVQAGFEDVRFVLPLRGEKTPDLVGFDGDEPVFCEVKTIDVSDREATRRAGRMSRAEGLADDALLAKCVTAATRALAQVREYECECRAVVYLFLNADDGPGEAVADIAAQVRAHLAAVPELAGVTIHVDHDPPPHSAG